MQMGGNRGSALLIGTRRQSGPLRNRHTIIVNALYIVTDDAESPIIFVVAFSAPQQPQPRRRFDVRSC